MDTENESFFIEALSDGLSDEVAQILAADSLEDLPESRDTDCSPPTKALDTGAEAVLSEGITAAGRTSERPEEQSAPSQAMLIFVMGEDRFSDSCELGLLNEHPEPLKAITSNQCLTTSGFLKPVLRAAIAELRPSMMVQVAVRLTAITLRLVADILPTDHAIPKNEGVCGDEHKRLLETVCRELEQAVPYYHWQGPRNYCGRVQYLMALLEEAVRVLGVSTNSLTEALEVDEAANRALERVARSILKLGQSPADVCGVWAAETVLSAWALEKASFELLSDRSVSLRSEEPFEAAGKEDRHHEAGGDKTKICKSPRCMTPDSESEDELPSPSTFIQSKRNAKTDNDVAKPGSRAGRRD